LTTTLALVGLHALALALLVSALRAKNALVAPSVRRAEDDEQMAALGRRPTTARASATEARRERMREQAGNP
jgi:hypothetical protein